MSCGLPVIVTEDPDNRYWIEDGVNGFIIPVKSPNILAELIKKLINNKKLRKEMGEKNRKIIEEKNNYYVEMGKMEKEYEKLINKYSAVKKDAVKAEVTTLLTDIKTVIEENKTLITKAPRGKEGAAVLEQIKAEMTTIEGSVVEAQDLFDKGSYMDALNKIKAAQERAAGINTELKEAIAKVRR